MSNILYLIKVDEILTSLLEMASRNVSVHSLLENNRLLIGNQEPRSALIHKEGWKDPIKRPSTFVGESNFSVFANNKKYGTYDEFKSRKKRKKKERNHTR